MKLSEKFTALGTWSVLLIILILPFTLKAQENPGQKPAKPAAEITFETTVHDFGKLTFGGDGTYEFKFKNTGKEPLVINNVKTSCGCTVPVWPKEPINKRKSGTILVKYDTKRQGNFSKTITVYSNGSIQPITLTIKGEVQQPTPQELEQMHTQHAQKAKEKEKVRKEAPVNLLEKEKSLPEKK
ncbi:MAG: DUF1573 domain-containing protein [Bacteroidales bacterium]|nr:DUF1573 domain-containing protein [Bacteroidales bacterium]